MSTQDNTAQPEENQPHANAAAPEQKPTRRMFLKRSAQVVGGLVTAGAGALALPPVQRMVYSPKTDLDGNPVGDIKTPEEYGLTGIKPVMLSTREGEEFLTWQSEEIKPNRKTLLFFTGNYGHMGHSPDNHYINLVKQAKEDGYQIIAVNHVGFAGSGASITEPGMKREAERVVELLVKEKGLKPNDISIAGLSMGTFVAAHAANHLAHLPEAAFERAGNQHIRCLLINGIRDVGVVLNKAPIIGQYADMVWHDRLDAGKELRDMAALSGTAPKRVHVTFLRGDNDKYTPESQMQAHEDAASGLNYTGKQTPGEHFLPPEVVLASLKEMDAKIQLGGALRP